MFITREGYKKLEAELDQVLHERDAMMQSLGDEARSDGYVDLRENTTFMEKRTRLQNEYIVRIAELRNILAHAKIVEDQAEHTASDMNIIRIGSKITLLVENATEILTIVGKRESNPRCGLISYEAPVGQALMGKTVGDRVKVTTPGGIIEYTIMAVEYIL